jgi:hypothetical protein
MFEGGKPPGARPRVTSLSKSKVLRRDCERLRTPHLLEALGFDADHALPTLQQDVEVWRREAHPVRALRLESNGSPEPTQARQA